MEQVSVIPGLLLSVGDLLVLFGRFSVLLDVSYPGIRVGACEHCLGCLDFICVRDSQICNTMKAPLVSPEYTYSHMPT